MAILSCRQLLEWEYETDLLTRFDDQDFTVGLTAVEIAVADPKAITIEISNFGGGAIAISSRRAVTATTGILIAAGATREFWWQRHGEFPTSQLFAISPMAGNAVHVMRQLLVGGDE